MKLIIVESPTKAKTLRGFLGPGHRVLASMGHIRDLPPKQLGVDVEHDFRPTYHLRKGARKVIQQLREATGQATAVYLATDPDREGEAIAWHVTQVLRQELKDKSVRRATFHEITPPAVQAALSDPGHLDMDLVNAQQARRILDRLVGYQVSPVLWKAVKGRKGLSAGRVQTVALRLVVERDREIAAFVPAEYWTLDAEFSKVDDERHFRARLVRIGKEKPDLKTEADAQAIVQDLEGAGYRVLRIQQQRKTRRPYPPYITSTLQQDAASRLGWPAAKTMRVAQQLYEGVTLPDEGTVGLITYMRTDSTHVAESAQAEAREIIARFWGPDYLPSTPPQYKTRAKVAQEAHEAIRPTASRRLPRALREHLTPDQAALYELIWRRFIASQMKPAVYKVTTADIACARDDQDLPYLFRATGREILFEGFLKAYQVGEEPPGEEEGAADQVLPPLVEGEPLVLHGLFPEQRFTKPPPHFTEASLIQEMERSGIGRPSTYASIVHTIVDRGYVERQRQSLLATELGFVVCDFLVAGFPDLFAVGFTAQMEEDLDGVARGERPWLEVLRAFYGPFAETVGQAQGVAQAQPVTAPGSKRQAVPTGQRCPACGRDLVERKGKRGVFWGCSGYPGCRYTQQPQPRARETATGTPASDGV